MRASVGQFFLTFRNVFVGCDRRAKRRQLRWAKRGLEELPHVRGQGQKPGGLHA